MNDIIKCIKELENQLVVILKKRIPTASSSNILINLYKTSLSYLDVPESFLISKYPITQIQWEAVSHLSKVNMELNPYPSYFKGDNLPVEGVNWEDTIEFCNRLSIFTGIAFNLPSKAQWEYASYTDINGEFCFRDNISTELANYDGRYDKEENLSIYSGEYLGKTTPVGSYPSNPRGLYDMQGNVWEWCLDTWKNNYIDTCTVNTINTLSDENVKRIQERIKTLAGGSWYSYSEGCIYPSIIAAHKNVRRNNYGFRISAL